MQADDRSGGSATSSCPGTTPADIERAGAGEQNRQETLPPPAGTEAGGTIELHLSVGVGQVEVTRAAS